MSTDTSRTRLSPAERRTQLLELGVQLFATRPLEELSIDAVVEEAGVSRGLIYHYFDGLAGYKEALVRYAADDLFARTAPPAGGSTLERLAASLAAYVDYVEANEAGYRSLVAAAQGGRDALRAIYDTTFEAMGARIFVEDTDAMIPDSPAARLVVRGWQAMVENTVLAWCADKTVMSREDLLRVITDSLPGLVALV